MKLYAITYGGSYNLYIANNANDALLQAAHDEFTIHYASNEDIDWHPSGLSALKELATSDQ